MCTCGCFAANVLCCCFFFCGMFLGCWRRRSREYIPQFLFRVQVQRYGSSGEEVHFLLLLLLLCPWPPPLLLFSPYVCLRRPFPCVVLCPIHGYLTESPTQGGSGRYNVLSNTSRSSSKMLQQMYSTELHEFNSGLRAGALEPPPPPPRRPPPMDRRKWMWRRRGWERRRWLWKMHKAPLKVVAVVVSLFLPLSDAVRWWWITWFWRFLGFWFATGEEEKAAKIIRERRKPNK